MPADCDTTSACVPKVPAFARPPSLGLMGDSARIQTNPNQQQAVCSPPAKPDLSSRVNHLGLFRNRRHTPFANLEFRMKPHDATQQTNLQGVRFFQIEILGILGMNCAKSSGEAS